MLFSRLIPCYYLSNMLGFLGLPGPGDNRITWQRTVKTLTMTNTWHWFEMVNPYAMPAWTVSTLAAFYMVFPFLLRRLLNIHAIKPNINLQSSESFIQPPFLPGDPTLPYPVPVLPSLHQRCRRWQNGGSCLPSSTLEVKLQTSLL